MVTAAIKINQSGKPAGSAGESRDDLDLGILVSLSNNDNTGIVSWNWEFVSRPPGSSAILTTPTSSISSFVPDIIGSYLIKLTVTDGGSEIDTDQIIAAIQTSFLNIRIPAAEEQTEFNETYGWAESFHSLLLSIDLDASISLKTDGTNYPTENIPWNNKKITELADPTLAQDAATKNYVDTSSASHTIGGSKHTVSTIAELRTKISDYIIIGSDTTAGGDLSGTYPNPTISGIGGKSITGSPADNNVLQYNLSLDEIQWSSVDFDSYNLKISSGDTTPDFLETKIIENLNISITKQNSGADEFLTIGTNEIIKLPEQSSDPSYFANDGYLYTKDSGGNTELYYLDSSGNVIQITNNGGISVSSSLDASYNGGRSITADSGSVDINASGNGALRLTTSGGIGSDTGVIEISSTQTVDDKSVIDLNHDYDGNIGSVVNLLVSSTSGHEILQTSTTIDKLTISRNVNVPDDIWYTVGGGNSHAALFRKVGNGDWAPFYEFENIYDNYPCGLWGNGPNDFWVSVRGTYDDGFRIYHYNGSWTMELDAEHFYGGDLKQLGNIWGDGVYVYALFGGSDQSSKLYKRSVGGSWSVERTWNNVFPSSCGNIRGNAAGDLYLFTNGNLADHKLHVKPAGGSWGDDTSLATSGMYVRGNDIRYHTGTDTFYVCYFSTADNKTYIKKGSYGSWTTLYSSTTYKCGNHSTLQAQGQGHYLFIADNEEIFVLVQRVSDSIWGILHYNGSTWNFRSTGVTPGVWALWGLNENNVRLVAKELVISTYRNFEWYWNGLTLTKADDVWDTKEVYNIWGWTDSSEVTFKYTAHKTEFTGDTSRTNSVAYEIVGASTALTADSGDIILEDGDIEISGKISAFKVELNQLITDPSVILDKGILYYKDVSGNDELFSRSDGGIVQITNNGSLNFSGVGEDSYKSKVSSNDTTPNYLENKFSSGSNISIVTLNDGSDESLKISADLDSYASKILLDSYATYSNLYTTKISSDDTTDGYLSEKIIAGSNINIVINNPGGSEELVISSTASGSGSGLTDGYLAFPEKLSDPPKLDDYGSLYTKDSDGYTELHYIDNYGSVVQITSDGYVTNIAIQEEEIDSTGVETYIDLTYEPANDRSILLYQNGLLMRKVSTTPSGLNQWKYNTILNRCEFNATSGSEWYYVWYIRK